MRVAAFSLEGLLHEGPSALVYAGVRDADGTRVVAKLGRGRRDLAHEALVLDKLAGPGVVETFGVFDSSEGPMLVQRRFGTSSLAAALRGGRFAVPRVLRIGLAIARVLARVHAARFVHRDIKPANILYDADAKTEEFAIALADFAIAAELPVHARALPVGDFVGTPGYVSPEHTGRTSGGCDARSDLYSLGVTLYELLVGARPFAETDVLELTAAHLSRLPEPPNRRAAVPQVVSDIVMKLLAKAPDQRYQSARGLAADLERCLAVLGSDGRIAPFPLGGSDFLRPRFPQRLFGRSDERMALAQALARAAVGAPTLVLLSGRDGAGRSELVRDLAREVSVGGLAVGGWTAAGDGPARPLAGLADALGSLANGLLLLDEDQLAELRQQFAARMGQIGQVIVDIAPALGDVFGPQPALVELPAAAAARARLHHGLRCFAGAVGHAAPFVLALRNFDQADPASVGLIEALLASSTSCPVLLVLMANDPAAFGALAKQPHAVAIDLPPLSVAAMIEWAAATLGCDAAAAAELGEALHERSGGNPAMFVGSLEHLVELGAIEHSDGRYAWSIAQVRAAPPPPTLGSLASQRITELDGDARRMLAAVACSEEPLEVDVLAAMLAMTTEAVAPRIGSLAREGLVNRAPAGYAIAHPVIAATALAAVSGGEAATMRGRLAAQLIAAAGPTPTGSYALRVATALDHATVELADDERARAAELYVLAAEHVTASVAYEAAEAWFSAAGRLLGDAGWRTSRDLRFRSELGRARALMMLGRNAEAVEQFRAIAGRELSANEIGLVYPSWCDCHSTVMQRTEAIDTGLAGLARLGIPLPPHPSKLRPMAAIRLNQRYLSRLSPRDHAERPDATDQTAVAAAKILSTLTAPTAFAGRAGLNVLVVETGIGLALKYGHIRNHSGFLASHAAYLHVILGNYAAARKIYEACLALEEVRPAPELMARTYIAFHYMVSPWFGPWKDSAAQLARAIRGGIEAGDAVWAAFCASASITMLNLTGAPLDRIVAAVEGWGAFMRGDGGVTANAANIVHIAGKLSRGEPIVQADLDRVTNVPMVAGPMRNNAMVNFGLALAVIGHEGQVRAWLDEIRAGFAVMNWGQPHTMTLWLLDGLFAAKDARLAEPEQRAARRAVAEQILDRFRMLRRETLATNNDAAIHVLEALLARADGDLDRAAGLFARAARAARAMDLTPLLAYANEQRAEMLDEAGCADEATLYYREAVFAYRRWSHLTKAAELEAAHPAVRAKELATSGDARRTTAPAATVATMSAAMHASASSGVNDQLDLVTVLNVSQDISTQLTGSGVVRAVLLGVAQNAGAERVVFVLRSAAGVETVYGEAQGGRYRNVGVAYDDYPVLPKSVVRVVRRTGRPLVVADAASDPGHVGDAYVADSRSRSIACIPVRRKGEIAGFVVLENRMVAGAFTPQLVNVTQALVTQAAISLDNASLYQDLENRVNERTAALHARNAGMRLVLDNVAQGLVVVDRAGRLSSERSAVLATWFPDGVPETLTGLFSDDEGEAAWFELAWEQLVDDILPLDLALYQMPKQLRRGDRILAFEWQPILCDDGSLERVLMVLSDVTEAVRRVEAEREQKQLMAIFEALSEDRSGVVEFLKEANAIVGEIAAGTGSPEVEKRLIHTLKGNSALFGLSALAARCHEIEDAMAIDTRPMTAGDRAALTSGWKALHEKVSRFIDVGDGFVQVRKADYEALAAALRRDAHPAVYDVELWNLEPLRVRFQRVGEQARSLAERLGKGPVQVRNEHAGVHIDGEAWAPFWSAFVHVVRNAIDHGLEEPAERARLGKGIATLTLRSYLRAGRLVIEFSDDGRGIAWDKLADKARAAGLPTETRKDLVAALFHDGISTRSEATEMSGRGVGLGALAQVCREMDCEIAVDSTPGQGTTMRFELPGHYARTRRERPTSRELLAVPAS